jgi:hypothetical protein
VSRILIGTASWTDKSLIASGRFYPSKSNSAEERLRYYASQFPIVEVDSSYCAMPAPQVAQLWAVVNIDQRLDHFETLQVVLRVIISELCLGPMNPAQQNR